MKIKTLEEEALDLKLSVEFSEDEIAEAKARMRAAGFSDEQIAEGLSGLVIDQDAAK